MRKVTYLTECGNITANYEQAQTEGIRKVVLKEVETSPTIPVSAKRKALFVALR